MWRVLIEPHPFSLLHSNHSRKSRPVRALCHLQRVRMPSSRPIETSSGERSGTVGIVLHAVRAEYRLGFVLSERRALQRHASLSLPGRNRLLTNLGV
jgi:hypothetical protein